MYPLIGLTVQDLLSSAAGRLQISLFQSIQLCVRVQILSSQFFRSTCFSMCVFVCVCGSSLSQQRAGEFLQSRQPVPSIKQFANEQWTRGEGICFQFPFDLLVIMLITGTGFNDFGLGDIKEKVIYYCCISSSLFTMHTVNMKITIAEDHIQWLGRLN